MEMNEGPAIPVHQMTTDQLIAHHAERQAHAALDPIANPYRVYQAVRGGGRTLVSFHRFPTAAEAAQWSRAAYPAHVDQLSAVHFLNGLAWPVRTI